jgi:hypothetical protein
MSIDFCDDLARAARHKDGRKFERQLNSVGRRTLRLFTLFRRLRFLLLIPIIGIGAIVACAPSPPEPPAADPTPMNRSRASKSFGEEDYGKAEAA